MQMLKAKPHVTTILTCAALLTALLIISTGSTAHAQVPPPDKTPLPTATQPGSNTPIPPTNTPVPPTNTPVPPTNTPIPPTNTPIPPTNTAAPPANTPAPVVETSTPPTVAPQPTQPLPADSPPVQPEEESKPDPNCQSVVKGLVLTEGDQRVAGATITIEGEGWSRRLMSGDAGTYGFGGLCSGPATLVATLPDGALSPAKVVSLNGKDTLQVNLGTDSTTAPTPGAPTTENPATDETASAENPATTTNLVAQAQPTAEPSMPATGFPGWTLIAVALAGGLVLLSAGALWSFSAKSDSNGQD